MSKYAVRIIRLRINLEYGSIDYTLKWINISRSAGSLVLKYLYIYEWCGSLIFEGFKFKK